MSFNSLLLSCLSKTVGILDKYNILNILVILNLIVYCNASGVCFALNDANMANKLLFHSWDFLSGYFIELNSMRQNIVANFGFVKTHCVLCLVVWNSVFALFFYSFFFFYLKLFSRIQHSFWFVGSFVIQILAIDSYYEFKAPTLCMKWVYAFIRNIFMCNVHPCKVLGKWIELLFVLYAF